MTVRFASLSPPFSQLVCCIAPCLTLTSHARAPHRADVLHSPQRRPYLLSPFSISHVAQTALQATRNWLTGVVLRVGSGLFSAASGVENVGVSSSRWANAHESRVLFGRREHGSSVGGHLPGHMLNLGVDSAENMGGTLKEE